MDFRQLSIAAITGVWIALVAWTYQALRRKYGMGGCVAMLLAIVIGFFGYMVVSFVVMTGARVMGLP